MIWWFSLSMHSFSHFLLCPLNSSHTEVLSFLKTACCALYNFQAFGYTIPWEREWCFLVSLFGYSLFILLAKLRHQFCFEIRYQQREERKRSALPSPSFVLLPLLTSLTLYTPTTSSRVILYHNAYLLASSLKALWQQDECLFGSPFNSTVFKGAWNMERLNKSVLSKSETEEMLT